MLFLWVLLAITAACAIFALYRLILLFVFRAPSVAAPIAIADALIETLHITHTDVVVDLGCGNGLLLDMIAKKTSAKSIGYEISPLSYLAAKIRASRNKVNTKIYLQDYFSANIAHATVIYCFLIPSLMDRTAQFIKKNARPGTRIASYGYILPGLHETTRINVKGAPSSLYFYKLEKSFDSRHA